MSKVEQKRSDDWTRVQDPLERRRLQNRNAQRNHRQSIKRRLESLENAQHRDNAQSGPQSLQEVPAWCFNDLISTQPVITAQETDSNVFFGLDFNGDLFQPSKIDSETSSDALPPQNESSRSSSSAANGNSGSRMSIERRSSRAIESPIKPDQLQITDSVSFLDDNGLPNAFDSSDWVKGPMIQGKSALHMAVESRDLNMVSLLMKHNANVNASDKHQRRPLHLAAESSNADIVVALLGGGADVEGTDVLGQTAIHVAAKYGHDSVLRLLMPLSRSINHKDNFGATALHYAAQGQHEAAATVLLLHGADANIGQGMSP